MNDAALLNMIISVLLSIAGALMAWAANKLHSIDKAVAVHEERLETHAEDWTLGGWLYDLTAPDHSKDPIYQNGKLPMNSTTTKVAGK